MTDLDYTFAVARTRALEVNLFSGQMIDQLIGAKTYEDALRMVDEKGWGESDAAEDADKILADERNKIWTTVRELGVDMQVFDVLMLPSLYHNVKTAIKESYTGQKHDEFFFDGTSPSRDEIRDIIEKKEFAKLPGKLAAAASEAFEELLHTGDGQMCDITIDSACLSEIYDAGQNSTEEIIRTYADTVVTNANIKVAVRCAKTKKSPEFMRKALVRCSGVDIEALIKAAGTGVEGIVEYLSGVGLETAAEELKTSMSAFERWCDNHLMEMLRPQKYEMFTVGPIVAYVLARENEIKTVGIVLSGKRNNLLEEQIRERIREMYV